MQGHFVRIIGPAGDVNTETECIMIENSLTSQPFGEFQVVSVACLTIKVREMPVDTPKQPWAVTQEELGRRRDIRQSHLVMR